MRIVVLGVAVVIVVVVCVVVIGLDRPARAARQRHVATGVLVVGVARGAVLVVGLAAAARVLVSLCRALPRAATVAVGVPFVSVWRERARRGLHAEAAVVER